MSVTTEKNPFQVKFSYLDRQFANVDRYLADVKALVQSGDFTLGRSVEEFERRFAEAQHEIKQAMTRDLYDVPLRLSFVRRLRDEMEFDGVESLRSQIEADCRQARELFSQISL